MSNRGSYHLNRQAARQLAAAPKAASTTMGLAASRSVPPKLINWCKASIAQPAGTQWAIVLRAGGSISSGHQRAHELLEDGWMD